LPPKIWDLLQEHVLERYGLDISDERERKHVFFLCRTALAQGKVGSYVEQYQGMLSLTRSLAASCIFAVVFYAGWMLAFCLQPVRSAWDRIFICLPVLAALVPFILILRFHEDTRKALHVWKVIPETRVPGQAKESTEKNDWKTYVHDAAASLAVAALLCAIGFVAEGCFNLTEARTYQLAALSSMLLLAVPQFLGASDHFDRSFATSVFRDFIVLSTGQTEARNGS
jgi:hypothetical protein